jgi:hypothetical protein
MNTKDTVQALDRLLAVRPQLAGVATAAQAVGLAHRELLHAGPPLVDACRPPAVLMSSAVIACMHEGWASDAAAAEALVRSGAVRLRPAQDLGVVAPLAAMVSAATPLFEVSDPASGWRAWAPVSAVRGPDTRMGFRDPALLARLAVRDGEVAPAWRQALSVRGPLPLFPLAREGLAAGDDLHSRTTAANQCLADWLRADASNAALADALEATPLFFLTLWMAACSLVLRAAEGSGESTLVTRAGGNGEVFGIALASAPDRWITMPATPPQGRLMPQVPAGTAVCGAIGDSAVIDMLGFGGQRLAQSPEPLGVLGDFLPADHAQMAARLFAAPHPEFDASLRVGIDARRVVHEDAAPLVTLAMLAADGERGFVGRGVYRPPVHLFERAVDAIG